MVEHSAMPQKSPDDSKSDVKEIESFLKNELRDKLESEFVKLKKKNHSAMIRISSEDFKRASEEVESLLKNELMKKLEVVIEKMQIPKKGKRSKRQRQQHEIQHLPNETLLHIFQYLSYKDLNNVSGVSRRFYGVATDPNLWKYFQSSRLSLNYRIRMLDFPRFRKLTSFSLSNSNTTAMNNERSINQIQEVLQNIAELNLNKLHFELFNFRGINKQLFLNVVLNTHSVRLEANNHGDLEKHQLADLLENISGSKLKHLQFDHMDFFKIDPEDVGKAINSLESFSSEFCIFRSNQVKEIFRQMSEEATKMKSLKFLSSSSYNMMSFLDRVPALDLARGVNKLESLDLGSEFGNLNADQLFEMFTQMSVKTNLKKLHLLGPDSDDIRAVPAETLAEAVSKLEEFIAPRLEFSLAQIKCVLVAVSKETSKIRKLDLGSTYGPRLRKVDSETLMKVMRKTEMNDFKLLMIMRNIESRNDQVLKAEVMFSDLVEIRKRKLIEEESVEVLRNMPKAKRMKNLIENRLDSAFSAIGLHYYYDID